MNKKVVISTIIGGILGGLIALGVVCYLQPSYPPEVAKAMDLYEEAVKEGDHMTAYMACVPIVKYYELEQNKAKAEEWGRKGKKEGVHVWGSDMFSVQELKDLGMEKPK